MSDQATETNAAAPPVAEAPLPLDRPRPGISVVVSVPTRGHLHAACWNSTAQFADECLRRQVAYSQLASTGRTVPEARSECVRTAIDLAATHLLFVDADIQFDTAAVWRMLDLGLDVVGAAYAGRGSDGVQMVQLTMKRLDGQEADAPDAAGCVEVEFMGFGLMLLRVDALKRMEKHYADTLGHRDWRGGRTLVNLFHEPIVDGELLGEDAVFCSRWRAMGGKVLCYLDATVTHFIEVPMRINAAEVIARAQVPR